MYPSDVSSLCLSAVAVDLKGRIEWNELCPSIDQLGHAKVVLDSGRLHGSVTQSGGFVIPDVPEGTYILSVLAHDYHFDHLRIDVLESESLPEVRPYIPGTPLSPAAPVTLPYPIVLPARQRNDYFVPRQSFDVLSMFQSPMMLMMLGMAVMVLAMPYLMKNMDPNMLQDFNKRQARISSLQSSLQSGDISSGLSALMDTGDEKPAAASSSKQTTPVSNLKHRAGKNKRR
ncbi:hypothetical protein WOLCODRAFT_64155 [Wolfiporia cocos MD-104 SS10]|uniref:ER membrane protein complex subunit 7 beta-sandwich domain-containing protein n=1 Tax=Wolfiporia cocos (strain MD-104) TaxID=742152 RepID=A0A2H3IUC7_WOLCO|nr:hypothetical protein WOLCODRAFT_64155 [Wolfiporia cocos MD-104 SS10]